MRDEYELQEPPLSAEERLTLQERLWGLLRAQARRYTMGQNASVPEALAKELLASLCCTLELAPESDPAGARRFLSQDPERAYERGLGRLRLEFARAERLWRTACLTVPQTHNRALEDTLKSIGGVWKRYDIRYFAHQIPCDIDYQLCLPVSEELSGIRYLNDYLCRLLLENHFLSAFDPAVLDALLTGVSPDPGALLMSLCQPVAECALGCVLALRDPRTLPLDGAACVALMKMLAPLSETELTVRLHQAGEGLCAELGLSEKAEIQYFTQIAEALAPRLEAAGKAGDLRGVFLPEEADQTPPLSGASPRMKTSNSV